MTLPVLEYRYSTWRTGIAIWLPRTNLVIRWVQMGEKNGQKSRPFLLHFGTGRLSLVVAVQRIRFPWICVLLLYCNILIASSTTRHVYPVHVYSTRVLQYLGTYQYSISILQYTCIAIPVLYVQYNTSVLRVHVYVYCSMLLEYNTYWIHVDVHVYVHSVLEYTCAREGGL